jgi:ribosome-associated protein
MPPRKPSANITTSAKAAKASPAPSAKPRAKATTKAGPKPTLKSAPAAKAKAKVGAKATKAKKAVAASEAIAPVAAGAATATAAAPPPATLDPRQRQEEAAKRLAIDAARSLIDDKCENALVLDVRGLSNVWDFVVIGSGTSDRQMRSAAESVRKIAQSTGHSVLRDNTDERTTWVLLDCMDVCVHIFEPATRAYYDIENMFADAPRVAWERSAK